MRGVTSFLNPGGVSLHVLQKVTGHKSLGSLVHYLEADESEVLAAIARWA
jgi:hypothetical protein